MPASVVSIASSSASLAQKRGSLASPSCLKLHPWRDGYISTKIMVENAAEHHIISTVQVLFDEEEMEHKVTDADMIALFELIGSCFARLESVICRVNVSSKAILPSVANPPIAAITSLLLATPKMEAHHQHKGSNESATNRLQFLTMVGLRLLGDDYDMNGLVEAFRIHPTLHSVAMKNCSFLEEEHWENLKQVLLERQQRGMMKHCDLQRPWIVDMPINRGSLPEDYEYMESSGRTNTTGNSSSLWDIAISNPMISWCMSPVTCCI